MEVRLYATYWLHYALVKYKCNHFVAYFVEHAKVNKTIFKRLPMLHQMDVVSFSIL